MPIKENIIAVALKLTGGATFANLARDAEGLNAKLADLKQRFDAGELSAGAFVKEAAAIGSEIKTVNAMLDAMTRAQAQQEEATRDATAAIANQAASASAWGAVIQGVGDKIRDAADQTRKKADADAAALAAANRLIGAMTIEEAELAKLQRAEADAAVARRQQANAAAGVAREMDHLNDVLRDGAAMEKAAPGLSVAETAALRKREAATNALAAATGKAGSKMAGFGQASLQTGRVVQDFTQGGIGGILNNIEGLSQALGGGAGLAGVLTILGVAAFALKPYFAEAADGLGLFGHKVDETGGKITQLENEVKYLDGKEIKLAIDVQRLRDAREELDQLKKALADYKAAGESKNRFEKESGATVAEVLQESPVGEKSIRDQIRAMLMKQLEASNEKLRQNLKQAAEEDAEAEQIASMPDAPAGLAETHHGIAEAARQRAALARSNMAEAADSETGGMLGGAKRGDAEARRKLVDALRKIGQKDLAEDVDYYSPETARAQDAGEQRAKERDKAHQRAKERDQKRKQDVAQAVSDTSGVYGQDLGKDALDALSADQPADRGDLTKKLRAELRAKLDKENLVKVDLRDEVVAAVVDNLVRRIGAVDVGRARDAQARKDAVGDRKDAAAVKKAAAAQARGDRKAAAGEARETRADVGDLVKHTAIDEQAEAFASRLRAAGRGSDAQQMAALVNAIRAALARSGMAPRQAQRDSAALAAKAMRAAVEGARNRALALRAQYPDAGDDQVQGEALRQQAEESAQAAWAAQAGAGERKPAAAGRRREPKRPEGFRSVPAAAPRPEPAVPAADAGVAPPPIPILIPAPPRQGPAVPAPKPPPPPRPRPASIVPADAAEPDAGDDAPDEPAPPPMFDHPAFTSAGRVERAVARKRVAEANRRRQREQRELARADHAARATKNPDVVNTSLRNARPAVPGLRKPGESARPWLDRTGPGWDNAIAARAAREAKQTAERKAIAGRNAMKAGGSAGRDVASVAAKGAVDNTAQLINVGGQHTQQLAQVASQLQQQRSAIARLMRDSRENTRSLQRQGR